MQSLIIDVINSKAIKLLQDLEALHLIRVRKDGASEGKNVDWEAKYKGAMSGQSKEDIDKQLKELREGWE